LKGVCTHDPSLASNSSVNPVCTVCNFDSYSLGSVTSCTSCPSNTVTLYKASASSLYCLSDVERNAVHYVHEDWPDVGSEWSNFANGICRDFDNNALDYERFQLFQHSGKTAATYKQCLDACKSTPGAIICEIHNTACYYGYMRSVKDSTNYQNYECAIKRPLSMDVTLHPETTHMLFRMWGGGGAGGIGGSGGFVQCLVDRNDPRLAGWDGALKLSSGVSGSHGAMSSVEIDSSILPQRIMLVAGAGGSSAVNIPTTGYAGGAGGGLIGAKGVSRNSWSGYGGNQTAGGRAATSASMDVKGGEDGQFLAGGHVIRDFYLGEGGQGWFGGASGAVAMAITGSPGSETISFDGTDYGGSGGGGSSYVDFCLQPDDSNELVKLYNEQGPPLEDNDVIAKAFFPPVSDGVFSLRNRSVGCGSDYYNNACPGAILMVEINVKSTCTGDVNMHWPCDSNCKYGYEKVSGTSLSKHCFGEFW
jgi:hypothetical protein